MGCGRAHGQIGLDNGSSKTRMPATPLISIVDDDDSVREALMSLMRSLGLVSEAYRCAEDFLQSGSPARTACLIADVRMPGMTGIELHRRLVASGHPIPTILITAHQDEKSRAHALQAGVLGYLSKPFDEGDLLRCIRAAIGHIQKDGNGS
jgi:FixJ family two-component response regulator